MRVGQSGCFPSFALYSVNGGMYMNEYKQEPFWRETKVPTFNNLTHDLDVDVAIVGGGISGITTSYLLTQEGLKVALLDAGLLLNGTTGHTTAKITAQHDLIYAKHIAHLGVEQANLYYQANIEALDFIKKTIQTEKIDCDFSMEDAYIYTCSDDYTKQIEEEARAYEKLGIDGYFLNHTLLPFPIKAAITMKNQAQFHPLKYLTPLVKKIIEAGGQIFENTVAIDIETGDHPVIKTRDGHSVTCRHVISCSHFPFFDGGAFYFARMHAERSYVLGVKAKQPIPDGMYISAEEPKRSLRYTTIDNETLLLVGGESHKAGQGSHMDKHYKALEQFAEETFGVASIPYRWSTQDLKTLDDIPYIGRMNHHPNSFVATGYRKWGMTSSTVAAHLLRDLIMERENPYEELYSPSRFHADPSIKNFVIQTADMAKHLIGGKLGIVFTTPNILQNNEGAVVNIDGKRAGGYRDNEGCLHLVDTTCTHMGCEVNWNDGDKTWDCPCHGSRYSVDGDVLEGPAKKALSKIEIDVE